MKIELEVEFDQEAIRRGLSPALMSPPPEVVLADVNRELRLWASSNPYALQNPEHLALRLALVKSPALAGVPESVRKIAADLDHMAEDLATLARLARVGG